MQNVTIQDHNLSCSILNKKLKKKDNKVVVVGLIQWSNSFLEDATWEGLEKIQLQFL